MKKIKGKIFRWSWLSFFLLLLFHAQAFSLPNQYGLSFTGDLSGQLGDLLTVSLIAQIPDSGELVSGDLNLAFDDTILSLQEVRFSPDLLGMAVFPVTISPASLSFFTLDALIGPGSYTLAELDFLIDAGASSGATLIDFAQAVIPGGFVGLGDNLLGDVPLAQIVLQGAEITVGGVQPVPEPSTFILIGIGLTALLGMRRVRRG